MNKNRRYDLSGRSAVTSYRLCRLGVRLLTEPAREFCVFQRGGEPSMAAGGESIVMPQISSTEHRRELHQGRVMESGLPAVETAFLKKILI